MLQGGEWHLLQALRLGDEIVRNPVEAPDPVQRVVRARGHTVAVADFCFVHVERDVEDLVEFLIAAIVLDARWRPLSAGLVGRGFRVEVFRVNCQMWPWFELTEQRGNRQPHHAGAQDSYPALAFACGNVCNDNVANLGGAAPTHGDTRATVAVVVDYELVADLLRLEPIAILSVRPQARDIVHAQAEIRHGELVARCFACRGIVLRQRDARNRRHRDGSKNQRATFEENSS